VLYYNQKEGTTNKREVNIMTNITDTILATLETIAMDTDRDLEQVEAEFFALASSCGMSDDEAIGLWNECQVA